MSAERRLLEATSHTPETLVPHYDLRTLDDLEREGGIAGKVVLLRVDLDLPNGVHKNPDNDLRFENAISAVADLMKRGAKQVRILGHIARPQEEIAKGKTPTSTRVLLGSFYRRLGEAVAHVPNNMDVDYIESLSSYPVLLYENVRMAQEEEMKIPAIDSNLVGEELEKAQREAEEAETRIRNYVRGLAQGADSFVNDAFAVVHREENKTVGALAQQFRGRNAAGEHLVAEMEALLNINVTDGEEMLFVISGVKVDKKKIVDNLARFEFVHILVGGRLASLVSPEDYEEGRVDIAGLSPDGFDIDEKSRVRFAQKITSGRYLKIVLNGPLGKFEDGHIAGSKAIAEAMEQATSMGLFTMVGGGDTGTLLAQLTEERSQSFLLSHSSAGGGAMLAVFEGDRLGALAHLARQAA